ncbi:MAG: glutamate synthase subunit beta [Acholeplasmatales bacterium]|jgi:glutamate synthase (NADPH/NADH) small chain|nr:glutamate synthase subunit beta [Acholeplasmatales bacterium]
MGKPTGFMEYNRLNKKEYEVLDRIKNFNDFHIPFDLKTQKEQASRCMNCGVPFCQSAMKVNNRNVGCPLANLIPEWNHLIYLGLYEEAYKRLEMTAPFPEFTGNVCPALCEACCSCSIHDEAVGVKANELFLIEEAFKNGWIKPKKDIKRCGKKIAVIGSGPSGLSLAKRLNDFGFTVTVYEKNDRFGGLLMYGIPNMKLEKHIIDRRIHLLMEEGIVFIKNTKIGQDITIDKLKESYDDIVFACGTQEARGLSCTGSDAKGILYAVDFLKETTKNLLDDKEFTYDLKGKNVIIVGGGDTANDCCGTAVRENAKSVIELEITKEPPMENTLPWPNYPNKKKTDYGVFECNQVYGKDIRRYETTIDEVIKDSSNHIIGVNIKKVEFNQGKIIDIPNTKEYLECDYLIIAMGFLGTSDDDATCYQMKVNRNRIPLKDFNYDDHIYVCGDMKNGQSLVVQAIKDGMDCANKIIEKYR